MIKSRISTYRYRIGKNQYIVINIHQQTSAATGSGNAVATNAVHVQVQKEAARQRRQRRSRR